MAHQAGGGTFGRRLRAAAMRVLNLLRGGASDREFSDEVESHLQLQIDDNIRSGMSPEEARRQALIRFGGVEAVKESYRDRRSIPMAESFLADLRYGTRMMRRNPGFTAVAVLSLAVGIGATAAIFSVVNAVVLRSLPVPRPGELRTVRQLTHQGPVSRFSYLTFERFRRGLPDPDGLAAMSRVGRARLRAQYTGQHDLVAMQLVSGMYFTVLDLQPALGRLLTPADSLRPVAVISHTYWMNHYAGDSGRSRPRAHAERDAGDHHRRRTARILRRLAGVASRCLAAGGDAGGGALHPELQRERFRAGQAMAASGWHQLARAGASRRAARRRRGRRAECRVPIVAARAGRARRRSARAGAAPERAPRARTVRARVVGPAATIHGASFRADGDGLAAPADRLREHRQPPPRPRVGATARAGGAPLDRREPRARDSATAHREPAAWRDCRRGGPDPRAVGERAAREDHDGRGVGAVANLSGSRHEGVGVRGGGIGADEPPVRPWSGMADLRTAHQRCAAGQWEPRRA